MNYEIEQKLANKADRWELDALRQNMQRLSSENQNLKDEIQRCQSKLSNHYVVFERIIRILIESNAIIETSELHELQQYI